VDVALSQEVFRGFPEPPRSHHWREETRLRSDHPLLDRHDRRAHHTLPSRQSSGKRAIVTGPTGV